MARFARTLDRRGALIAASVLIHAAILLPIAFSSPKRFPPPDIDVFVLPLDLTPGVSRRRGRPSHVRPDRAPSPPRDAVVAEIEDVRGEPASPPSLAAPVPAAAPTPGVAAEDQWRVRAGLRPPARLPCPPAPGDRLGQRLCLVGAAPDRDREPETYAEVAPSRQARSDEAREEGFDRQARANEAWRDYTRGDGAYPGLRSLFQDR